jgi:acetolactate synthase-1/2/3 large subunit
MTVSDYVASFLYSQGVRHVFAVSGGMITFLLDSLNRQNQIKSSVCIMTGGGFSAEGLARMDGVPGIALATSGPGAINLLTGIGSCHFDSTPAVFITGRVNRSEQKGGRAAN